MTKYIYGKNPLKQLLQDDKDRILKIFILPQETELINNLKKIGIKYTISTKEQLNELVSTDKHQGVVILIDEYNYLEFQELVNRVKKKRYPLIVMCDQIEDPRNLGAILRTCDATGVDGVIILDRRQVQLNATVAKTSAGAINYVPVVKVNNLSNALTVLKEDYGFWVVATAASSNLNYHNADYDHPVVLIVGSEGKGITRKLLEHSDFVVKIPMFGRVSSLNVSVAAALLLYQIRNKQT